MSCIQLHSGQDLTCRSWAKKYYQQIVLVNKDDVEDFDIKTFKILADSFERGLYRHRISFSLFEGKKGFRFRGSENGISYRADFSKQTVDNIVQYDHNLELPIMGATEETKGILKELDNANYFAAIQFMDGTVEIYGFDNGLTTGNYTYDLQGNLGGSFIPLQSRDLEDEPPYVFYSDDPNQDFNELFENSTVDDLGSFNDDFNHDFDVTVP